MTSWREERRATGSVERIDVPGLHELTERDPGAQILDVRERPSGRSGTSRARSSLPYHDVRGIPDGPRRRAPDRRDLQLRPAQRRGRQPAAARTAPPRVLHVVDGGVGTWARHGWPVGRRLGATGRAPPPGYLFYRGRPGRPQRRLQELRLGGEPYITECPYCGQRLRKRAPKLRPEGESAELAPAKRRRRRVRRERKPREERALSWLTAGGRPYATITLVLASAAVYLADNSGELGLYDLGAIIGPLEGDWWRLVAAQFVYENVGYLFAVGVAAAIFGTSLERRYSAPVMLLIFLGGGAAGMYAGQRDRRLPARDGRQRIRARDPVRVAGPRPARPAVAATTPRATCSASPRSPSCWSRCRCSS